MATVYTDKWNAGVHSEFQKKVAVALDKKAASAITSGPPTLEREKAFVRAVLASPEREAEWVAKAIAANLDVDNDDTDADIQTAVDNNWSNFAWAYEPVA